MKRRKYAFSRRTHQIQFVESTMTVPCPHWLQRKMRSNLKRAMRCPVSAHRAARAAQIMVEASREPEPVVSPQPAVTESPTPSPQASPALKRVPRVSQHTAVRSPRWSPKSVVKAAMKFAQGVVHPRVVFNSARVFGRRIPA